MSDIKVVRSDLAIIKVDIDLVVALGKSTTGNTSAGNNMALAVKRSSAASNVIEAFWANDTDSTVGGRVAVLRSDVETELLLVIRAVVDCLLGLEENVAVGEA